MRDRLLDVDFDVAFQQYMNMYASYFFDTQISPNTIDNILSTCHKELNERYQYLLHSLWLIGDSFIIEAYEQQQLASYITSTIRILDRMPFLPEYNDFELIAFIKSRDEKIDFSLFRNIEDRQNTAIDPEVRKFIYQFIIQLKISHQIPVAYA